MNKEILKKSLVLLIDDIPENLQVLAGILYKENVKISIATNAKQGIETANNIKPDLILLDVTMPEMDGYEACKILQSNPETSNIPVIFLTARIDKNDVIKGFESGGVDYVTKPYNATELISRVITHLELKHSKEELKKMNDQLIFANKEKDKFLSIISHDLRSPFAGILGLIDLMVNDYDSFSSEEIKEYLGNFQNSAKVQFKFLENLLAWGNFQLCRKKISKEKLNLKLLIENNFTLLNTVAKNKNIDLVSNVSEFAEVFADVNMIPSVSHNMISNSIKFTKEGGKIEVYSTIEDEIVKIEVRDNGVGMNEKGLNSLFRIDTIFSNPGTNDEKGTGLGLILCQEMIEKNNGKIWAESILGKGTSFFFTLPKYNGQSEDD